MTITLKVRVTEPFTLRGRDYKTNEVVQFPRSSVNKYPVLILEETNTLKPSTTETATTSPTSTTNINNNNNNKEEKKILFSKGAKGWGDYDERNMVLVEKITADTFFYKVGNASGKGAGLVELISKPLYNDRGRIKGYKYSIHVPFKDGFIEYVFKENPKEPVYFTPSKDILEQYINGKIRPLSSVQVVASLKKALSVMFEFVSEIDLIMSILFIMQSYVDKKLNAVFLASLDAKFGAGKSTLLEIICLLLLHGLPAGDISKAVIPRWIDEERVRVGIDEIDQLPEQQKEETEQMLRRGQRKGNPYIRFNKNTGTSELFDTFGQSLYTRRGDTEDALKSRSIDIHCKLSTDKRLPIINLYKENLLQQVQTDLWLWYLNGIHGFSGGSGGRSYQVLQFREKDMAENIDKIRETIYKQLTVFFTKEQLAVFDVLVGRNIEIAYLMLQVSNIVGVDFVTEIKEHLEQKQQDLDVPDSIYLELLADLLRKKLSSFDAIVPNIWHLEKGDFADCFYYPKNTFFIEFTQLLKELGISTIGTNRFKMLLSEVGFIEDLNIKNQKHYETKVSVKCLIFDKNVKAVLYPEAKPPTLENEDHEK